MLEKKRPAYEKDFTLVEIVKHIKKYNLRKLKECVKKLDLSEKPMFIPLLFAFSLGYIDCIRILLNAKASVRMWASQENLMNEGLNNFFYGKKNSKACNIKLNATDIAPFNSFTLLHLAVMDKDVSSSVLRLLISAKADIEAEAIVSESYIEAEDRDSDLSPTPLVIAILTENFIAVKCLIESKASQIIGKSNKSALMFASSCNEKGEIVELLIKNKANVNEQWGEKKLTALHESCAQSNLLLVNLLMEHGADSLLASSDGIVAEKEYPLLFIKWKLIQKKFTEVTEIIKKELMDSPIFQLIIQKMEHDPENFQLDNSVFQELPFLSKQNLSYNNLGTLLEKKARCLKEKIDNINDEIEKLRHLKQKFGTIELSTLTRMDKEIRSAKRLMTINEKKINDITQIWNLDFKKIQVCSVIVKELSKKGSYFRAREFSTRLEAMMGCYILLLDSLPKRLKWISRLLFYNNLGTLLKERALCLKEKIDKTNVQIKKLYDLKQKLGAEQLSIPTSVDKEIENTKRLMVLNEKKIDDMAQTWHLDFKKIQVCSVIVKELSEGGSYDGAQQFFDNLVKVMRNYEYLLDYLPKRLKEISLILHSISRKNEQAEQEKFSSIGEEKKQPSLENKSPIVLWHLQNKNEAIYHEFKIHYKIFWKLSEKYSRYRYAQRKMFGDFTFEEGENDFSLLESKIQCIQKEHTQLYSKLLQMMGVVNWHDYIKEINACISALEKNVEDLQEIIKKLEKNQVRLNKKIENANKRSLMNRKLSNKNHKKLEETKKNPSRKTKNICSFPDTDQTKREEKNNFKSKIIFSLSSPFKPSNASLKNTSTLNQSKTQGHQEQEKISFPYKKLGAPLLADLSLIIMSVDQGAQFKNLVKIINLFSKEAKIPFETKKLIYLSALAGIIIRFASFIRTNPLAYQATQYFAPDAADLINKIRNSLFNLVDILEQNHQLTSEQAMGKNLEIILNDFVLLIGRKKVNYKNLQEKLNCFDDSCGFIKTNKGLPSMDQEEYGQLLIQIIFEQMSLPEQAKWMEVFMNALLHTGGLLGKIRKNFPSLVMNIDPTHKESVNESLKLLAEARHTAFPNYEEILTSVYTLIELEKIFLNPSPPPTPNPYKRLKVITFWGTSLLSLVPSKKLLSTTNNTPQIAAKL